MNLEDHQDYWDLLIVPHHVHCSLKHSHIVSTTWQDFLNIQYSLLAIKHKKRLSGASSRISFYNSFKAHVADWKEILIVLL